MYYRTREIFDLLPLLAKIQLFTSSPKPAFDNSDASKEVDFEGVAWLSTGPEEITDGGGGGGR